MKTKTVLLLVLALGAMAQPGAATLPGSNGPLALGRNGVVYTVEVDGTDQTAVADGANPSWSPDGSRLVYSCEGQLCIVDLGDGSVQQVTTDATFRSQHPAWSPDGEWIVFRRRAVHDSVADPQLFKIRPDGSEETELDEQGSDPAWSPEGDLIAFTKGLQGNGVFTMRPDGTGVKEIFPEPGYVHGLSWSPDGTRVAFLYQRRNYWRIWTVRRDGSRAHEIFRGRSRCCKVSIREIAGQGLAWSPDGARIIYANQLRHVLCLIDLQGNRRGCLDVDGRNPDWSPAR